MTTTTTERLTSRLRLALIVAGVVAGYFVLDFVLPQKMPPGATLFALYQGLMAALIAAGLILVYRSVRIINFAQIVFGGAGATLLYELTTRHLLPYGIGLPLALLSGVLIGGPVGLL